MAVEWTWGHFNTIAKRIREERELLEANIKIAEQPNRANKATLDNLKAQLYAVDNITYRFAEYFTGKCENFVGNTFITRSGFKPKEGSEN